MLGSAADNLLVDRVPGGPGVAEDWEEARLWPGGSRSGREHAMQQAAMGFVGNWAC